MKILFIPDNFPPEVNALARRTYEHSTRWVERGTDVSVITCAPNFPQGKVYPGYRNKLYQKETMDGIQVTRVWSYIAPNAGVFKRVLDQLSFAISGFIAGLFSDADVFIASTPHFFPCFTASALSLIKRRPWIFEVRDLWTESIVGIGVVRRNLLIRALVATERALYRQSACIVVVSPAFKECITRHGIDPAKIEVITNSVDRRQFPVLQRDEQLARELNLRGKFVIGYIGTHGMAHGLDFILRSIAKITDPRLHFLFIGDGAEKRTIIELGEQLNLTNATFLNQVPHDQVPRYLSLVDVSLVPLRKLEVFKTVIPSKIFESASMNKPILMGVDGQARTIMEQYGSGLYFEPEDETSFLNAVRRLVDDPGLIENLKTGSEKLAQTYDRTKLADRMLEVIEEVVNKRRKAGLRDMLPRIT